MHHVMTALGYTVTSCTERREPVLAENPVHCLMLDRELAPGTCIGTRTIVEVETAEGIPGVAHMEVRPLYQPGEVEHMRSEEHTSELQSLLRNSYAVFCLKKKKYI